MSGGYWGSNDLRSNITTGRVDYGAYGAGAASRGYGNGVAAYNNIASHLGTRQSNTMGLFKGAMNPRADAGQRTDRGQFQTGLDSYGSRSVSDPYQGISGSYRDAYLDIPRQTTLDPYSSGSYKDPYSDSSRAYGALYVSRDQYMESLRHSVGATPYLAADRKINSMTQAHQGQGGMPNAGRKRGAGGMDAHRQQNSQSPYNRTSQKHRGKGGAKSPTLSNKMKSMLGEPLITGQRPIDKVQKSTNIIHCTVCDIGNFKNLDEYNKHQKTSNHTEMEVAIKVKNKLNLEYLRAESKLASKKVILDNKKNGSNVEKLIWCQLCQCDFYGTYINHKTNIEHQLLCKFEQPRCCGKNFNSRDSFMQHEMSYQHLQQSSQEKLKKERDSMQINIPGQIDDLMNGKIYNLAIENLEPYNPCEPFGVQVLSEHPGYICELCPMRQELNIADIKKHCSSSTHYESVLKHLAKKSGKTDRSVRSAIQKKMLLAMNKTADDDDDDDANANANTTKKVHSDMITDEVGETFDLEDTNMAQNAGSDNEIDEDALDFENI